MTYPLSTRIGIIGGGQLGKMMTLEAKKMGFWVAMIDPTEDCPSHSVSDMHIVARFDDREAIRRLSELTDVLTYESEHIDTEILLALEGEGKKIYPTAGSLKIIQDKFTQKAALRKAGIPVPDFREVSGITGIKEAAAEYGYPMLLKTCKGGYDGKGNALIRSEASIENAFESLGGGKLKLMAERFVPFVMEISVLACRGINGEIAVYPVAQNLHEDNILKETRVPAAISEAVTKRAMDIAHDVMEVFRGVGMFCVEMFVDKDGNVSVNEVAPRPHNSGHYSIEACVVSQFEQHIRAITGLPFGDTSLVRPACMKNLLGDEGYSGKAVVLGAEKALRQKGAALHIYGKSETRPARKMGHLTATAETLDEAVEAANAAAAFIKIISE